MQNIFPSTERAYRSKTYSPHALHFVVLNDPIGGGILEIGLSFDFVDRLVRLLVSPVASFVPDGQRNFARLDSLLSSFVSYRTGSS
jgi:hypothetical protein